MNCSDKINIYVPENIGKILERDAMLFEIFKKDGRSINKNRFLSMLVKGYYNTYETENQATYLAVFSKIGDAIPNLELKNKIVNQIVNDVIRPKVPSRKGKNPTKLSLKPTTETKGIITRIIDVLGDNDYISQYFCRMLMSYCEKPFSVREQIIFDTNYRFLEDACKNGKGIVFSTIWNDRKNHYVYPYKIVSGVEEMFNYLLCCEMMESGKFMAKAYRLNRISQIDYSSRVKRIPNDVTEKLNLMMAYGPQFEIGIEERCCVKLNKAGMKMYNRIYYGRPIYEYIETKEDGDYYYFNCSEDQLYLYFKRFENDSAIIISPNNLKERIKKFHLNALLAYEGESE